MNGISRKTAAKVGVTSLGALALAGALASTSVAAGTTYTVAVGSTKTGNATLTAASSGNVTFNDISTGLAATCSSATASLTAKLSSAAKAAKLTTITKSTYSSCSANGELELNIKQSGKWTFNATGPTASGVTPGVLTKIKAAVTSTTSNCKFTTAGTVDATYNNTTGVIAFAPKSGTANYLIISKQTGQCFTLANNGDKVTFTSNFKVTATSPTGAFTITSN